MGLGTVGLGSCCGSAAHDGMDPRATTVDKTPSSEEVSHSRTDARSLMTSLPKGAAAGDRASRRTIAVLLTLNLVVAGLIAYREHGERCCDKCGVFHWDAFCDRCQVRVPPR